MPKVRLPKLRLFEIFSRTIHLRGAAFVQSTTSVQRSASSVQNGSTYTVSGVGVVLILFSIFYFLFSNLTPAQAVTGVNNTINVQGKVTNSNGTNVADGVYDFVFKLYDGAGSGATATFTETWSSASLFSSTMSSAPASAGESATYSSNTNESSLKAGQYLWNVTKKEAVKIVAVNTGTNVLTISPTAQAWNTGDTITNKIYVRDGIFQVALNSLNADAAWGTTDFGQSDIFLGINFNADGEMKPRSQFSSVPYAFQAKEVAGLSISSGKSITFNNSLTFSGSDGTVFTLPSGSGNLATSDVTTGQIAFGNNTNDIKGDAELWWDNTNKRLGVGTSTPGAKVDISGSLSASGALTFGNFATNGGILYTGSGGSVGQTAAGTLGQCLQSAGTGSPTWGACNAADTVTGAGVAGQLAFFTDTNEIASDTNLIWDSSNRWLGIGAAPSKVLDIIGPGTNPTTGEADVRISSTTGSGAGIQFSPAGTGTKDWLVSSTTENAGVGAGQLSFWNITDQQYGMVLSPGGKLGLNLGFNSPTARAQLQIGRTTAPTGLEVANSYLHLGNEEWAADSYRLITFGYSSDEYDYAPAYMGYKTTDNNDGEMGVLVFGTRDNTNDGAPLERMRITENGRVGIGIINPDTALDVRNNSLSSIGWGSTSAQYGQLTYGSGLGAVVRAMSGQVLNLGANGNTSDLVIDTSGQVGIGGTPTGNLDVQASVNNAVVARIRNGIGAGNTSAMVGLDIVATGASGGLYAYPADYSTGRWQDRIVLKADSNSAGFSFESATSGQDIRFFAGGTTESMRLTSTGLGIGTVPTVALDVSGAAKISGAITFSSLNTNGGILYTNGSGVVTQTTAGSSGQCLQGGTTHSWVTCGDTLPSNNITGSGLSGRLAIYSGTYTTTYDSALSWNSTNETLTISSTTQQAGLVINASHSASSNAYGLTITSNQTAASSFTTQAAEFTNNFTASSGTLAATVGLQINTNNSGSGGTLTTGYGLALWGTLNSGTSTGTINQIRIDNVSGSGSLGTQRGVLIEDLTKASNNTALQIGSTGGSGNYAIYSSSSNDSYLAGNLGIGTSSPGAPLQIGSSSYTKINGGYMELSAANSSTPLMLINGTSSANLLVLQQSGSNKFVVGSTGNASLSGSLGINATPGSYRLDVQDNLNATSSYVARIQNTSSGNNANALLVDIGISAASRKTTNHFVSFATNGSVAGAIIGAASGVTYHTTTADFAEYFRAKNAASLPQPGELVSLVNGYAQTVDRTTVARDQKLMGVISTSPAFLGNGPVCDVSNSTCEEDYAKTNVIVALAGQVPTHVSTENGAIAVGDLLTSSSTPGVAMKANTGDTTIGTALQSYASSTVGSIKVLINLEHHTALLSDDNLSDAQLTSMTQIDPTTVQTINLKVAGALTVDGPAEFKGPAIFRLLAEFFDKVIFHSDVIFEGRPTFNKDTAGFATIHAGQQEVAITFDKEYADEPITNATLATPQLTEEQFQARSTGGDCVLAEGKDACQQKLDDEYLGSVMNFVVTKKSTTGFTIRLSAPADKDLRFNWTALAVKDARNFEVTPTP